MKFEHIKKEGKEGFRRLIGIKRTTFEVMVTTLRAAETELKRKAVNPINCR